MTDIHLINTINMLKRQIDGSIHDEFVYDNVIAMEDELKRRKQIPFHIGQIVYVIEEMEDYHHERYDRGYDHVGWLGYETVRVSNRFRKVVKEKLFNYGLLDTYNIDEIYATKHECERRLSEMSKIVNVDLKVVGVTFTNDDGEKRSDIIRELADKDINDIDIQLVREPDNRYDMNAVKVLANDRQIGYIGKDYASIIAPLMDEYEEFSAVVKGIGEYKNRPYCEITINQQ